MTVTVIGAGLSGLATAWYLAEAGVRVRVIEAASRPGGLIQTIQSPHGVVETAARGFIWNDRTGAMFAAMGLVPSFARDASKRRYIFRDGRPQRWPLTAFETAGAAARFSRAWIGRQVRPRPTESVATWGARVIGPSATTWLLAPALQGIYASAPSELSAAALFGRKRSPRGKLGAPAHGMGELIQRLHERLRARGVSFEFGCMADSSVLEATGKIVISTPAPAAAKLVERHAPALAAAIARIRMVSIVVATSFYEPHEEDLRGFGVLFPRAAGVRALGTLFNAEIFEGRSRLRSETWMYGDLDLSSLPATERDTLAAIAADRRVLTGRSAPPVACHVTAHRHALPVYDSAVLDAQAAAAELPPNVAIAGNFLGRLGVSALLDGAWEAAQRVNGTASSGVKSTRRPDEKHSSSVEKRSSSSLREPLVRRQAQDDPERSRGVAPAGQAGAKAVPPELRRQARSAETDA